MAIKGYDPVSNCQGDMAEVERLADRIIAALDDANAYVDEQTWVGGAAEEWSSDWRSRYHRLKGLLTGELQRDKQRCLQQAHESLQKHGPFVGG